MPPVPTSVVTGGAGFLGSHLCDALIARGHRVICVDNLETGSLANVEHLRGETFLFLNHDLTEHLEVEEPVDFVYHLASPASPPDRSTHGRHWRRSRHEQSGSGLGRWSRRSPFARRPSSQRTS